MSPLPPPTQALLDVSAVVRVVTEVDVAEIGTASVAGVEAHSQQPEGGSGSGVNADRKSEHFGMEVTWRPELRPRAGWMSRAGWA